jgi:hypothetical protein
MYEVSESSAAEIASGEALRPVRNMITGGANHASSTVGSAVLACFEENRWESRDVLAGRLCLIVTNVMSGAKRVENLVYAAQVFAFLIQES